MGLKPISRRLPATSHLLILFIVLCYEPTYPYACNQSYGHIHTRLCTLEYIRTRHMLNLLEHGSIVALANVSKIRFWAVCLSRPLSLRIVGIMLIIVLVNYVLDFLALIFKARMCIPMVRCVVDLAAVLVFTFTFSMVKACIINYTFLGMLLLLCGDIEINPGPNCDVTLTIYHVNVRSLRNKVDLVSSHADKYDVVAFTESKLDQTIKTEDITIPGYHKESVFRKDKTISSGGICVQLGSRVLGERLALFEEDELELLWLKVSLRSKTFIIGTVYRNPALPVAYWENLQNNIARVVDAYGSQHVIVIGDLNEDLLKPSNHHLVDIIDTFAFEQLITDPTRITEHSATLLDPFICGAATSTHVKSCRVLSSYCSDHCPILCTLGLGKIPVTSYKRRVWLFNNADWNRYLDKLNEIDWESILNGNDINTIIEKVTAAIISCAESAIPSKVVRTSNRDKYWITPYIKSQIHLRDKLFRKSRQTKHPDELKSFRSQRNLVVKLIREAKNNYQQNLVNKMRDCKFSDKQWWKLMKTVIDPDGNRESIPPLRAANKPDVAYTDEEKAEMLNEYFADVCNIDDQNLSLPKINLPDETLTSFNVTLQDVSDVFKAIDLNKAYGCDEIGPRLLHNGARALIPVYFKLFRLIVEYKKYPSLWKKSNTVGLFKKGDRHLPSNYRPISLLCLGGKLFEKILYKNVYNHVRTKISPLQSGFLPGHSTTMQLLEIYHLLMEHLDRHEEIAVTFFDISKAFDKVSHKALLHKLEKYGITGDALALISSYLEDRVQRVVINGKTSSWKQILAGVPQGSILGPLFFLLFINDIVDTIENNIRLFADDTSLFKFLTNVLNEIESLQSDINKLTEWANVWYVTFNEVKTKLLRMSNRRPPSDINLNMNGHQLALVHDHKHLGITIDNTGSWTPHIADLVKRTSRKVGILRNLKYKINRKSLEMLYTSYVRSIFDYCDIVWDNLPNYLTIRIEKVQIESLRIISGLTVSCSNKQLYKETGFRPLSERRKIHRLIMFYKILHEETPDFLRQLLPERYQERHGYATRHRENFVHYLCRTESFAQTFYPKTLKDWEKLPLEIREKTTLNQFKNAITVYFPINPVPPWYYTGQRQTNILLCKLRNNCSALNHHLYVNHVIANPYCFMCTRREIEDNNHYLFVCPRYAQIRRHLFESITNVFREQNVPINYPITIELLLFGQEAFNIEANCEISRFVQNFILNSRRF